MNQDRVKLALSALLFFTVLAGLGQGVSLVYNGGFEIPDSIYRSPDRLLLGNSGLRVDATDVPGWLAIDDNEMPYRTIDLEILRDLGVQMIDVFDFLDTVVTSIDLGRTSLTFNSCGDGFRMAGSESMMVSKLIVPLEPRHMYKVSASIFVPEKFGERTFPGLDIHFYKDSVSLLSQVADTLVNESNPFHIDELESGGYRYNCVVLAAGYLGDLRIGEWQQHSVTFTAAKRYGMVSIGKYLGRLGQKCPSGWWCLVDNFSIEEVIRER
ncbi:MAG: hypothetical protein JNN32_09000 [Flavobacteriales bacterium]|nr:hypothetical protein [Flavobacteriales bacterium]